MRELALGIRVCVSAILCCWLLTERVALSRLYGGIARKRNNFPIAQERNEVNALSQRQLDLHVQLAWHCASVMGMMIFKPPAVRGSRLSKLSWKFITCQIDKTTMAQAHDLELYRRQCVLLFIHSLRSHFVLSLTGLLHCLQEANTS